jgi:hypothetical protein
MTRGMAVGAVSLMLTFAAAPSAQVARPTPPRTFRLTASAGVTVGAGYQIGDRTAELRRNTVGSAATFTLFDAASAFQPAAGIEARVAFRLTPAFSLEGGMAYSRPRIDVTVSDDVEGANGTFEGETTMQYVIEASVLWRVPGLPRDGRVRPFVIGGGGYLRQLHEPRTLVETGQVYHLGGGLQYVFEADQRRRPVGLRGDIRAYVRKDGIEFADRVRLYPALSALVFVGF